MSGDDYILREHKPGGPLRTARITPYEVEGFTFYRVEGWSYTSENSTQRELVLDMLQTLQEAQKLARFWLDHPATVEAITRHACSPHEEEPSGPPEAEDCAEHEREHDWARICLTCGTVEDA